MYKIKAATASFLTKTPRERKARYKSPPGPKPMKGGKSSDKETTKLPKPY